MATLRITNFPDALYQKLKELAEREHRTLSQQVILLLKEALGQDRRPGPG